MCILRQFKFDFNKNIGFFVEVLLTGLITSQEEKIIWVNSHIKMVVLFIPKNMILFCVEFRLCVLVQNFSQVLEGISVFFESVIFLVLLKYSIVFAVILNYYIVLIFFFLQKEFFLMNVAYFMYL